MTAQEIADRYWQGAPRSKVRRRAMVNGVRTIVLVDRWELAKALANRFGVSVDELEQTLAADLAS